MNCPSSCAKKNITDISTVKYAVLETDGSLSTILYADQTPLTPKQMNVPTDDIGYPVMIINDGRVLSDNLNKMGYNDVWLMKQLKSRNIKNPEDVYLMTTDESGHIYFAVMENVV